jgi:hypothetical protein
VSNLPSVPRWTGPVYLALGVVTVGWAAMLTSDYVTTPRRCPDPNIRCGAFRTMSLRQYNLAWVVFDIALAVMLLVTGWLALRRKDHVQLPASVTGALLFVDAWFDMMTTTSKDDHRIALAQAVFVEVPLAVLCIWTAVRAERVRRSRLAKALLDLAEQRVTST